MFVGIDLGGTFIKFGILKPDGPQEKPLQLPTPKPPKAEALVEAFQEGVMTLLENHGLCLADVQGVGLGAPGPLDPQKGILKNLPNLPGLNNCPIQPLTQETLGVPVFLENDANAAAFGEFKLGAGRGATTIAMLTLGTGIGSGIIVEGRILHGGQNAGGELGHTIIHPDGYPCNCGQRGCLEQYASAGFIARNAAQRIQETRHDGPLAKRLAEHGEIDAKDINDARKLGDPIAVDIWDELTFNLAIGCVNLCRLFDPQIIVFAGGLSKAGDDLILPLREQFNRQTWTLLENEVELRIAELGNDAGWMGAACVARRRLEEQGD